MTCLQNRNPSRLQTITPAGLPLWGAQVADGQVSRAARLRNLHFSLSAGYEPAKLRKAFTTESQKSLELRTRLLSIVISVVSLKNDPEIV